MSRARHRSCGDRWLGAGLTVLPDQADADADTDTDTDTDEDLS
ncbi:hypothetical protein [Streptomyces sioyaensis]|nr:hypothetical protein [Streptomyces sioyaensis]